MRRLLGLPEDRSLIIVSSPRMENSAEVISILDSLLDSFPEDQKPLIGVIYNPISSELYYAADGLGAFLNQKKISFLSKFLINIKV